MKVIKRGNGSNTIGCAGTSVGCLGCLVAPIGCLIAPLTLLLAGYMAHDTNNQGSISFTVQNGDTYYAIVRNTYTFGLVKIYQATLAEQ
jgi:hypothetical protein